MNGSVSGNCGHQCVRVIAGAPFTLHRGSDRAQRHVWVAESGAEGGAMLRWQSHKGMSWQRLRASRANVAKVQYHEAAVRLIQSVTYGMHLLPHMKLCELPVGIEIKQQRFVA